MYPAFPAFIAAISRFCIEAHVVSTVRTTPHRHFGVLIMIPNMCSRLVFSSSKLSTILIADALCDCAQTCKRNLTSAVTDMQAVCSWARRFHQIFGPLGIVMLLVFAISGCWTVFLVTLSLFPNEVANYLMETGTLDRGNFWQLQKSNPQITGVSVFVLLFVALCYFYLFMTVAVVAFPSSSRRVAVDTPPGPGVRSISRYHLHRLATHVPAQLQRHFSKLASFHGELTMQSGRYRKIWNVFMEIPEIILQSISFAQYMYEGLQEPLVLGYAALMGLNCFIIFYNVEFGWRAHAFHEIVSDAILDVVFAVFFPAIVLFYSVNSFRGDLESIKLRQKYFPPQDFERSGQLYAEAEPIATFTSGYESLRMYSFGDILLKLSFNILTCIRWRQIVFTLLRRHYKRQQQKRASLNPSKASAIMPSLIDSQQHPKVQPKRVVPRVVGYLFLLFGIGILTYSITAVVQSSRACHPYSSCVLHSHVWQIDKHVNGSTGDCFCLAYVNRILDVNATNWAHPADVTEDLAFLARPGRLELVTVINLHLAAALPSDLRSCRKLRRLVIINAGVQVFPPWTVDTFANLDTLHIEGKRLINNLVTVPANLFSRMSRLRTLYLVNHPGLIEFPSLVGLRSLETMYLTQIEQITAIPSLEGLPALKTFGFTSMPFLAALPELTPLKPTLKTLVIQTSALCCSGYLDPVGACNVSHPDCELPPWGFDSRRCLPTDGGTQLMISNASRAIIQPFIDAHKVCDEATSLAFQEERRAFVPGQQDECEGVLYRHCFAGICYNPDLQEVRCVNDSRVIAMRKEVIARGGDCDTDNEAWLGCGTS